MASILQIRTLLSFYIFLISSFQSSISLPHICGPSSRPSSWSAVEKILNPYLDHPGATYGGTEHLKIVNPTKILGSLRHTWPVFTTLPTLNPCCDCLCCYKHVPHRKLISERIGVMLTTRGTLQLQLLYCWTVNKDAPHKQDGDESTPGQTPLPHMFPPAALSSLRWL